MESTRIYLVDDNDGFRESTAWLLETAGFEPRAYASAGAFLDAYPGERRGDGAECLISDIRMPQMSGLQLQDELGRRDIRLPLVFVTAHGDVPLAVEAMRKGASNFLEKPFTDEALVQAIRAALSSRQQAPARNGALAKLSPRERQVLGLEVVLPHQPGQARGAAHDGPHGPEQG